MQVLLATGEVPELPEEEDGGSLEILKPVAPAAEGGEGAGGGDAKGKGKGDDKKKDKKKEKGGEEGGEEGVTSVFVPNIRSNFAFDVCFGVDLRDWTFSNCALFIYPIAGPMSFDTVTSGSSRTRTTTSHSMPT